MNKLLKRISEYGIVPVIKINDLEKAVPLAKAIMEGGLPLAEVTFRTEHAEEAIKSICKEFPDMLVGAGTVLTIEQVDKAISAGSKFIVSPGFNKKIVSYCISKGITIIPGTSTPSDMEAAMELGLDVVKFFPSEQSGGAAYLKAVGGPYTNLKFIPTGGVNAKNLNEYLSMKNVVACGGTWMVNEDLIKKGDFDVITSLTKEAVKNMLGFELGHIGINCGNEEEARNVAQLFSSLFGFEYKLGNSSIFAGDAVEVMKAPYLGEKGHIAIKTKSVERAMAFLSRKGIKFNLNTKNVDESGFIKAIYFENEIGGFAVHLKK
ncbi:MULTISPECIES: bifunctional 4-hydroxy-2-oxoglutarate aldolase/2-dehydro-3-deoxy-phosphogluconate aldolase [unclassified Sedimentibacter]|uniref:bifunctional 4-hydroxy-2-oxoglutarate aldolase/2-dehydro-3-deoxy-phosphogluconate aldolase n=1 Tax=unclassified Sedimentibacter TaxID=2649220 RepID=UPI0027DFC777|nr:bifunctional 4-hydroxy-2-oxoglutarate aldolase/2-dehydro-3-deoxy-phosphogluconate aldolase [Sedimentibacter sp. MB35-C1]WMJ77542.1 bifunctional 4-hydroxy-2-oxoglutarate aldolase/2-dehydro-3-deoxy-phosphogluconate aldolase [Sedimentibacter sp. MB35-C1]